MKPLTTGTALGLAACMLAACARTAPPEDAAEAAPTRLAIEGHTNATPSVSGSGDLVGVAWGAAADGKTNVYVALSTDAGRTFRAPVLVDGSGTARLSGEMPPRVALRAREGGAPEIALVWTRRIGTETSIVFSRSTDGGASFSDPVALQTAGAAGQRGWPALTLGEDGVAHAVWLDHRGLAADGASHVHGAASTGTPQDGAARAQKSSIYHAAIHSGVAASEREIAKGVCYCCKTAVSATPSGDIHTVWRHVYPGNLRDMAFATATRGGEFGPPVRVSEDRWQIDGCPDDGPWLDVDRQGVSHVVWPSVYPGAQPRGAIFYASTRNGHTFSSRVEVPTLGSIKPSHPQIAVRPDGEMLVAWDEQSGSARVVAARRVSRSADGKISFGPLIRLAEGAAYYPALAATSRGFVAAWSNAGDSSSIAVTVLNENAARPSR